MCCFSTEHVCSVDALQRRSPSESTDECRWCWDECDASTYSIRSSDYMRTKQKVSSAKAFYKLVAADLFATDTKAFHIAKHMQLPAHSDPVLVRSGGGSPADTVLPPLMIFNIQLPNYPAAFFGSNDGPGQSIVFYFALPDDFDPLLAENQAAVGLLQRFVANGREADGTPTRERLKLIARYSSVAGCVLKPRNSLWCSCWCPYWWCPY